MPGFCDGEHRVLHVAPWMRDPVAEDRKDKAGVGVGWGWGIVRGVVSFIRAGVIIRTNTRGVVGHREGVTPGVVLREMGGVCKIRLNQSVAY